MSPQRSRFLDSPRPWLVAAAVVVIAAVLLLYLSLIRDATRDSRGVGGVAEIQAIADRSDVNVLFLLIDTLRASRMSTYGYERETTPNIDLLTSRGVRFGRNLAQSSWTKASMASLWTGLYPARAGVTRFEDGTPDEANMPAEILRDAGFRTVGIWRNGWVDPSFGFAQGFDTYQRPAMSQIPLTVQVENPTVTVRGTDVDVMAAAEEFLRVFGHERWFLYLHLMDTHEYVYDADSALFGTSYSDIYDNSIRRVDHLVGQLLLKLARDGDLERTLIVIASDHGEAFLERGFEGHARQIYAESTEVPLIFSFPFMLEPGIVVDSRSANVDIWPTILDVLGLESPTGLDGQSQLPKILAAVRGEEVEDGDRQAIAHLDRRWARRDTEPQDIVAVVEGPFRLLRVELTSGRVTEELFDSSLDGGSELENVIADHPEVAERLRERAIDYLENSKTPWSQENPKVEIDEMQLHLLRALGYKLP